MAIYIVRSRGLGSGPESLISMADSACRTHNDRGFIFLIEDFNCPVDCYFHAEPRRNFTNISEKLVLI